MHILSTYARIYIERSVNVFEAQFAVLYPNSENIGTFSRVVWFSTSLIFHQLIRPLGLLIFLTKWQCTLNYLFNSLRVLTLLFLFTSRILWNLIINVVKDWYSGRTLCIVYIAKFYSILSHHAYLITCNSCIMKFPRHR